MARGAKAVGDMRANEARAAGDKDTHPEILAALMRRERERRVKFQAA